ncbi:Flp pilus assembly protein CpaB [Niallia taxi]|uniref:Flp pilus assembly protein CpaB n=1 Tax=Niallia taxi TaxID=2499688 RepID=UPI0015F6FD56|nr:RcpC/CpaB family pilus assembly protein [Niallia taxi]
MHKWFALSVGVVIIFGSVAGYMLFMSAYEKDVTTMETIKPVSMIQAGEVITEDMVRTVSIPSLQHTPNAVTDIDEVVGKRAIVPIGESEEFVDWKVTEDDIYPKEGEQYYGFQISHVEAVNNMVRAGDRVNVWVNFNEPKIFNGNRASSLQEITSKGLSPHALNGTGYTRVDAELVLKNVKVASVTDSEGNEIKDTDASTLERLKTLTPEERDRYNFENFRSSATGSPSFITFIVSADQYQALVTAQKSGTIALGMENPFMIINSMKTGDEGKKELSKKESQESLEKMNEAASVITEKEAN